LAASFRLRVFIGHAYYRDKKVVGVFVRFRAPLALNYRAIVLLIVKRTNKIG
jgi:hypothetical protein